MRIRCAGVTMRARFVLLARQKPGLPPFFNEWHFPSHSFFTIDFLSQILYNKH